MLVILWKDLLNMLPMLCVLSTLYMGKECSVDFKSFSLSTFLWLVSDLVSNLYLTYWGQLTEPWSSVLPLYVMEHLGDRWLIQCLLIHLLHIQIAPNLTLPSLGSPAIHLQSVVAKSIGRTVISKKSVPLLQIVSWVKLQAMWCLLFSKKNHWPDSHRETFNYASILGINAEGLAVHCQKPLMYWLLYCTFCCLLKPLHVIPRSSSEKKPCSVRQSECWSEKQLTAWLQ